MVIVRRIAGCPAGGYSFMTRMVTNETAWASALPAKDFIQVDPANGSPATEPTEVHRWK
jgi:hypothetical protein